MSRWDDGLGVNSDDPDDLEVGCQVWSKTHSKAGDFPRGGTVMLVARDDDDTVMHVLTLEQYRGSCDVFEIPRCDIDMETVEWYGRNARIAAEIINKWLGAKTCTLQGRERLVWQRRAFELAEAGANGQWLPNAETRYRRHETEEASA